MHAALVLPFPFQGPKKMTQNVSTLLAARTRKTNSASSFWELPASGIWFKDLILADKERLWKDFHWTWFSSPSWATENYLWNSWATNNVQQSSFTAAASEDNPSSNSFPDAGYLRLGNSLIQPQDIVSLSRSTPELQDAVARVASEEVLYSNSSICLFNVCLSPHSFSKILSANSSARYLANTQVKGTWPCMSRLFFWKYKIAVQSKFNQLQNFSLLISWCIVLCALKPHHSRPYSWS